MAASSAPPAAAASSAVMAGRPPNWFGSSKARENVALLYSCGRLRMARRMTRPSGSVQVPLISTLPSAAACSRAASVQTWVSPP